MHETVLYLISVVINVKLGICSLLNLKTPLFPATSDNGKDS